MDRLRNEDPRAVVVAYHFAEALAAGDVARADQLAEVAFRLVGKRHPVPDESAR